jgi:hypothetical protein
MKQTNDELLKKFETVKSWMIADTQRAMFEARANFLVAQGLFNYTEIVGSFILPTHNMGQRFDAFFARMGPPYMSLLRRFNGRRKKHPHIIYDDLRCGLAHEYAIKRKNFIIYNSPKELSDEQINDLEITLQGVRSKISCGLIHVRSSRSKSAWMVVNPKYWLDFRNALDDYWAELNDKSNKALRAAFFKRARNINFLRSGSL